MLLMPRIHRRPIERLKSNRSIRVNATEPTKPADAHQKPTFIERRAAHERRRQNLPVSVERRRQERRNASRRLRPEIRALLQNSGTSDSAVVSREGTYIDEDV
jgi:hypothetical protein